MKNIIKVNNIQEAKDNPLRPIVALDNNGILFAEGTKTVPDGFVDLGLPSGTLWYNKNIGANPGSTPESWYGDYYAWGELETKTYYDWVNPNDATQNYKYANGNFNKLTKYCNDSGYGNEGYTDELTQLVPEDDVATVTNSAWRMPTKEDFEELLAGTTNSWVENYNNIEGLNGQVFTSKVNGNALFIPAAGYCDGSDFSEVDSYCYLWTSSLYLEISSLAYSLSFNLNNIGVNSGYRCYGFSIRPIC